MSPNTGLFKAEAAWRDPAMKAMQELVRGFVEEHGLEAPVEARLLDLVSEVGELSKEMLKATRYGRAPF